MITVNPHIALIDSYETVTGYTVVINEASIDKFKELVQRATNLWPDAPPEIKEFADLITNGKVLQNYHSQDISRKN